MAASIQALAGAGARIPLPLQWRGLELFLDRSNPLHWLVAAVLLASGLACAWIGVRDGFVRRRMPTSGGLLEGRKAQAAGALYLLTGLGGVLGAVLFALRGR